MGIKQHFRGDFPNDLVSLHLFEGGYCGLSKVENGAVNLCYLAENQIFKKYNSIEKINRNILSQNFFLKNFLKNAEPVFEPALTISQISFEKKTAVENHVLMAGDSAGLIHPLCGNGMAMAIHAGKMASEETLDFLNGKSDRTQMEKNYAARWNKTFRSRLLFGKWMQKLFENPKLLEVGISLGKNFPFLTKKMVEMSHGKTVN